MSKLLEISVKGNAWLRQFVLLPVKARVRGYGVWTFRCAGLSVPVAGAVLEITGRKV